MRYAVWKPGLVRPVAMPRTEARSTGVPRAVGGVASPAIVVGLGSPLAGDDGAGMVVARILRRRLARRDDVEVITLGWGGLRLMEAIRGWPRAILVDAIGSAGRYPAGSVLRLPADDVAGSARLNSCHDLSLSASMAFGQMLGWSVPMVEVYAIEGRSFERCTRRLSGPVRAGVRVLADLLTVQLRTGRMGPVEAGVAAC